MKVTFTKTGKRRYSVTIEGPKIDAATVEPPPGYHDRLPHDVAHFIVENELGMVNGIFGYLAARGTANTFYSKKGADPRKAKKRSEEFAKANNKEFLLSEHAVFAAQSRWEKQDVIPDTKIPKADIDRIISRFEEFAGQWTALPVGGSIEMEWLHASKKK